MTTRHTAGLALLLALVTAGAPARAGRAVAEEEPLVNRVKAAIDNGVRYLRELENDRGDFESTAVPLNKARPGGVTALAVVALLNAGVPPDDPVIQRCLKYLRGLEPSQSYTVGLSTMAFCLAGQKQDRQLIRRNLNWIARTHVKGGWGYDSSYRSPDHSINQYVLLGVHEARLAGFEVDREMLREMYDLYNSTREGQWGYRGQTPSLTMTTAGLCNLLITGEDIAEKRKLDDKGVDPRCGKYDDAATVGRALTWIGNKYPDDISKAGRSFIHPFYCLYGIERAGRLTGRRFFGEHDWYRVGCEYLVSIQQENGSWSGHNQGFDHWPSVSTSLSLLFLSKGRTPVLISKLAWGDIRAPGRIEEWNRKRSDVRHVVGFARRELFEQKPLGWQVFDPREVQGRDAEKLAEELLQTPIVYINGHTLTDILNNKDEGMLRAYLNNGGFLFAEACCNEKEFDRKFRQVIKKVTGSDLGLLPKNHPVWNASGKFRSEWRDFPELEGIQQGCKTVVIYSPKALAGYWENNDTTSEKGKKAFHLAANIIAYATGMELPKPRLTEVEIVRKSTGERPPKHFLQVVQLVTSQGAQPLAPKAIPNLMAEVGKLRLQVHQAQRKLTLTDEDVLQWKFFYMHDRNEFRVRSAEDLENLKFTLENRGTLFADAACGSKAFDKSFRQLVKTMWPDKEMESIKVKENQGKNGLYSREVNGELLREVKYRREEKDGTPSKDFRSGPPPLEGIKINGRWVVIYSKYDIGCALEKHQSTDCLGHDYESAVKLGKAVILYVLRGSQGG
ncbi:MAG: DUF4159 domain-containing protein [Planctomycetes bacterium]|nr:DUF4159 domain-containing protein [Planctomycetota bacterium]